MQVLLCSFFLLIEWSATCQVVNTLSPEYCHGNSDAEQSQSNPPWTWIWAKKINLYCLKPLKEGGLLVPAEQPVVVDSLSPVRLFATPGTVACQAPLSMGFSRQVYWDGPPFPSLGDLPHPEMEPTSLASSALAGGFFTTEPPVKPRDLLRALGGLWKNGNRLEFRWEISMNYESC